MKHDGAKARVLKSLIEGREMSVKPSWLKSDFLCKICEGVKNSEKTV